MNKLVMTQFVNWSKYGLDPPLQNQKVYHHCHWQQLGLLQIKFLKAVSQSADKVRLSSQQICQGVFMRILQIQKTKWWKVMSNRSRSTLTRILWTHGLQNDIKHPVYHCIPGLGELQHCSMHSKITGKQARVGWVKTVSCTGMHWV